MKRLGLLAARLLLAAIATFVTLKVGDVAWGLFRNTPERHRLRLPAGAVERHVGTEFDYVFTANRHGLRGPERPFSKPAGVRRLVLVGDSFVAGYGVPDEAVLTVPLERRLNERGGGRWEVINLGRTGSSTIRELDLYLTLGRRFEPDVVVLAYFLGNDLREVVEEHTLAELERWRPRGAVRRGAYGLFPNLYLELALLKLSQETAATAPLSDAGLRDLVRREAELHAADPQAAAAALERLPADVRTALADRRLRPHRVLPACYDPARLRRSLFPDDAYWQRAWPRTTEHLELLREAVQAGGATFALLIIPDAVQIETAAQDFAARIGYEVEPSWLTGSCRTAEGLSAWSHATATPCLDLTAPFRESPSSLYYPQDGHFNPAGHLRAAELLAEFLTAALAPAPRASPPPAGPRGEQPEASAR